ncbi:MotA/TolQ/ExbB proton channel family protein [Haloferula chungangensis]|uniref:MotA/TolQ/ExbB proton channel family protein n=1 Tax=Haloferula chungangensis TaxID=1048331 RepID=A0ABW2LDY4_9BACT
MFVLAEGQGLVSEVLEVFTSGGWIMLMLGSVAFILYATAFAAFAYVNRGNLTGEDSHEWEKWIENPESAEGRMGEAIKYVMHGPRLTIKTVQRRFAEVRLNLLSAIDRRLLVVNTLVAAAPLAGLLGTVMGMLAMFNGLAQGGGAAAMTRVAGGMKEALITTQTGLTIALPGLFIALIVKSKRDRISAALTRLESQILCARFQKDH